MKRNLQNDARSTTRADVKRIKKGNRLEHHPWKPPTALNNETLNDLDSEPRISLNRAVDLMAFGGAQIPKPPLEVALRRIQASRALCDAARTNPLKFIGNPDQRGDRSEPIPQAYFDMPRCLGDEDDTLITDLDKVIKVKVMGDFIAARDGNHHSWFNVRVETKPFLNWLRIAIGTSIKADNVSPTSKAAPPLQAEILRVAKQLWPKGDTPARVKVRNEAIRAKINPPPSDRTIRRAFASGDSGH
jgi:hypothetical protein